MQVSAHELLSSKMATALSLAVTLQVYSSTIRSNNSLLRRTWFPRTLHFRKIKRPRHPRTSLENRLRPSTPRWSRHHRNNPSHGQPSPSLRRHLRCRTRSPPRVDGIQTILPRAVQSRRRPSLLHLRIRNRKE